MGREDQYLVGGPEEPDLSDSWLLEEQSTGRV